MKKIQGLQVPHGATSVKVSDEELDDAILPRKRLVTRAMSKRLQEDWARVTEEGIRILMNSW